MRPDTRRRLAMLPLAAMAILWEPPAVAEDATAVPNFDPDGVVSGRMPASPQDHSYTPFEMVYELLPTSTTRWPDGREEQLLGSFGTQGGTCRGEGCRFLRASGVLRNVDLKSASGHALAGPVEAEYLRLGCGEVANLREPRWVLRASPYPENLEWSVTLEREVLSQGEGSAAVSAIHLDALAGGRVIDRGEPYPDEFEFTARLTQSVLRVSNVVCNGRELASEPEIRRQDSTLATLEIRAVARP